MLFHYWYFKDIGYKLQLYACNFIILNIKGVDYRFFMCNMSKNAAIKLLNNPQLDDKGIL